MEKWGGRSVEQAAAAAAVEKAAQSMSNGVGIDDGPAGAREDQQEVEASGTCASEEKDPFVGVVEQDRRESPSLRAARAAWGTAKSRRARQVEERPSRKNFVSLGALNQ